MGISREEVLWTKKIDLTESDKLDSKIDELNVGLKLSEDPFFQYIKNERLVWEMLVSPNETFTPEKIISLALRQDIGPDMASSRPRKVIHKSEYLTDDRRIEIEYSRSKYEEEMSSKLYYAGESPVDPFDYRSEKYMETPEPKPRGVLKHQYRRNMNSHDIHWRNLRLLSKCMNNTGTIKNWYVNRIGYHQQKKVRKAIINARILSLMPSWTFLQSYHKRSLKTLQEDVEDSVLRTINLETGEIIIKQPLDQWDTSDPRLAGKPNQYNHADFKIYEITQEMNDKIKTVNNSLLEDRKIQLKDKGIDPDV